MWVDKLAVFVFLWCIAARGFFVKRGELPETLDLHGLSISRLGRWGIFRHEWSLRVFNRSVRSCTLDALVHEGFVSRIILHPFLAFLLLQFWNFGLTSVYTWISFIQSASMGSYYPFQLRGIQPRVKKWLNEDCLYLYPLLFAGHFHVLLVHYCARIFCQTRGAAWKFIFHTACPYRASEMRVL